MRIDVLLAPAELGGRGLAGRVAAVIDVLRATSTIVEAVANGARRVLPAADMDDAMRLAQTFGRDQVLLCGERRSRKIEGFDLGNSPLEFTSEAVADRLVVMTTTNGTRALLASESADRSVVASYLNMSAAAAELAASGQPIVLLCAGRENRFSLDDALCAGSMVAALRGLAQERVRLNEAALAVAALERRYRTRLSAVIRRTGAARQIMEAGHTDDIAYCLTRDRHDVVPVMSERQILRAAAEN
ncbi:MAG TPA: 2-phosphosulfolactate phosphatase [Longimicrobiales bacterium]